MSSEVKEFEGVVDGGGVKFDKRDAKLRYELIPPQAEQLLAEVYTAGAIKYEDNNWMRGMDWARLYGAMRRHLDQWYRGEDYDLNEDGEVDIEGGYTGCHHLAQVAWSCFALLYFSKDEQYKKFDNRVFKDG